MCQHFIASLEVQGEHFKNCSVNTYLAGGGTVITNVVFPERGSPMALESVLTSAISSNVGNSAA